MKPILIQYGVAVSKPVERFVSPYEIEYKFGVPGNPSEAHGDFKPIAEMFETEGARSGFVLEDMDRRHKSQADIYFDDERLSLCHCGASFRLRKKDNAKITFKKRYPQADGKSDMAEYRRIEEEAVINAAQQEALMRAKPINAFPFRLVAYVVPHCGPLSPRVVVSNARRMLYVRNAGCEKAEISLDRFEYAIDGQIHGPFFEIEIEGKGADERLVRRLALWLRDNLGLETSRQSKYEKGASIILENK